MFYLRIYAADIMKKISFLNREELQIYYAFELYQICYDSGEGADIPPPPFKYFFPLKIFKDILVILWQTPRTVMHGRG